MYFPKVSVFKREMNGNHETMFETYIRVEHEGVWYDIPNREMFVLSTEDSGGKFMERFMQSVYNNMVLMRVSEDFLKIVGATKSEFQGTEAERVAKEYMELRMKENKTIKVNKEEQKISDPDVIKLDVDFKDIE